MRGVEKIDRYRSVPIDDKISGGGFRPTACTLFFFTAGTRYRTFDRLLLRVGTDDTAKFSCTFRYDQVL